MKQTLSKHAMTFVLLVVLVWHTAVSPSYEAAPRRFSGGESSDDDGRELARVREAGVAKSPAAAPRPLTRPPGDSVEDLDWPEVIGGD